MRVRSQVLGILLCGLLTATAAGQPRAPAADLDQRLRAVEQLYSELLKREAQNRQDAERRYQDLERKYEALQHQLQVQPSPPTPSAAHVVPSPAPTSRPPGERLPSREENSGASWWPDTMRGRFDDGFLLETLDEELQLRFHVLDQTDLKLFSPGDQYPARSGLYIPRVRVYFEGRLTRLYEYEVSLQRSVEGVWDLLDGNLNVRPSDAFQIKFGRQLVPYSYAWYDHLEQYFIVPERALFPLNFGLARSAGLVAHGRLLDDRLEYAVGGFDGRIAGVADNNTTRDAVGYLNVRPFLRDEDRPGLRFLNVGASGFIGQQVTPSPLLPLRMSVQTSENDEAAQAASAIFLKPEENVTGLGDRLGGAVHLAWYNRQLSLESEFQMARLSFARLLPDGLAYSSVPITGGHVTLGYFITGEEVHDRTTVVPLRPFRLLSGPFAPGAVELFGRYSQIHLGQSVFDTGLANPDEWTNNVYMTDLGFNWYLNRFVKLYFTWQHAMFGSPVLINTQDERYSRVNNLFWIRCQFYF